MQRNTQQNKTLHGLINKLGISQDMKQEMVFECSHGRTKSSADLSMEECQSLINHLKTIGGQVVQVVHMKPKLENTPENRMRRKILSICHEMAWKKDGKLDWERINGFLLKSGYKHKALGKYTAQELPILVTQFEQLLKDYYGKR